MAHDDFQWFMGNYSELQRKYGNCFLAIRDKKVIGVFESYEAGVRETSKEWPLGSFIVQEVSNSFIAYNNYIASTNFTV